MPEIRIKLPELHSRQADANSTARFVIYNCGRRFGKDILMMYRASKMTRNKKPLAWFAPHYRMMTENYNELYNILAPIVTRANRTDYRLEIQGGAVIDFWSLDNYNAARGRKYAHVTVNEAAASPNLIDAWNYVIRPTLADYAGGATFGSTPKGLNGFFTLWQQAGDNPEWERFHFTTYDNPYIPKTEIDAMRETMPDRVFRQEIMAEFLENGSFFQGVNEACTVAQPDKPADHIGHRFVAGLDWALSEDFTVLTVICATCKKAVDWWRANRLDFSAQRNQIAARLALWPGVAVLPERNSIGAPNIEMLAQAGLGVMRGPDGGLGFMTTSSSKAELINRLALAIEKKEVQLPTEYADELRAYEVTVTAANPKFSAPAGQHDDRVISAALAWYTIPEIGWFW